MKKNLFAVLFGALFASLLILVRGNAVEASAFEYSVRSECTVLSEDQADEWNTTLGYDYVEEGDYQMDVWMIVDDSVYWDQLNASFYDFDITELHVIKKSIHKFH